MATSTMPHIGFLRHSAEGRRGIADLFGMTSTSSTPARITTSRLRPPSSWHDRTEAGAGAGDDRDFVGETRQRFPPSLDRALRRRRDIPLSRRALVETLDDAQPSGVRVNFQ